MRVSWPCTLALSVMLGAPAFAAQSLPESLHGTFEQGVQALKAGRLDEAEAAFRRVLNEGGTVAFVHNNLGLVHQQRGRHEEAAAAFREAIRLDATYGAPRIGLGTSLLAVGDVTKARAALERAVELLPREPLARLQLAKACERAGDRTRAVEQYRKLRELAPQEPEYAYQLGRAYLRLSDWSLQQLRQVDARSARLHQALGHNYRVQGRPELAERAFRRAAEADPALPEIHLALAQLYLEQKRWDDARRELDLELTLVPESAGALALKRHLEADGGPPR
jgi:Flp pilus assembly protein TadD